MINSFGIPTIGFGTVKVKNGNKATKPCPCGYLGDSSSRCNCTEEQVSRYCNKISGPLLDRIDLHIDVPKVALKDLQNDKSHNPQTASNKIRERVVAARRLQANRQNKANYLLSGKELTQVCKLGEAENALLTSAMEKLNLSARSYHRILRLARTIADLSQANIVNKNHIAEAISYRILNRI